MTSFGPFEFSNKTYVKLLRRKKVLGHSRFTFTRFKCAPFHSYSLFASTWHGSDDRSKKYNFSPQNLHENMTNMAAVRSEKRRKLVQVKTSGNAIGDWRTGQLLACIASVSVWFRSKESPRNGIFGFGGTRKGTRAKKWNWGRRGMVRVTCAIFRVVFDSRSSFFAPNPHETRAKKWNLAGRGMVRVTCAIFRAVFDSRSSFFAPKPHGNACYAGYRNDGSRGFHKKSVNENFFPGLYPLVGWKIGGETVYLAEGNAAGCGTAMEWARQMGKNLNLNI